MDLPPETLNPPAIVRPFEEAPMIIKQPEEFHETPFSISALVKSTYTYARAGFKPNSAQLPPEEYMQSLCQNYGWTLRLFYGQSQIIDKNRSIPHLRTHQTIHALNHVSLTDVAQVPYNLRKVGLGNIAIVARDNMIKIPFFGSVFAQNPLVLIPFEGASPSTVKQIYHSLNQGKGLVWWGEGTRSRDGEVHPFKEGFLRVIKKHAEKTHVPIMISPEALVYSASIEAPFFKTADFFKKRYDKWWGKKGYYLTDLAAFGTRAIGNATTKRGRGQSIHIFGEPFDIREYRDESKACEEVQRQVSQMKKHYEEKVRDWPGESSKYISLESRLDEI